ncbi:hypothetical protein MKX03_006443 [Papaver bracteatum]|nr:hypothetical protein MKX03_006443 [Papaver bracteatum]
MACERFGQYKSVDINVQKTAVTRRLRKKPRTTGTKKCNFPFRLRATCFDGTNWRLRVFNGEHNHQSYGTLTGHSFSGRLNPAEKDLCISLSVNGVKPALILSTLKRQNKRIFSTARTIYNTKSKFRTKVMEGRTNMQKLLQLQLYSPNHLPSVIVTDDDLQLKNVVSLIFPEATRLLCTFHISCNVSKHFNKDIPSEETEDLENIKKDWENVWRSANHAMYEINLSYFLKTWSTRYPTAVSYLRKQWLDRKEQFVHAWTNDILHLGVTTTNRAESEHAALKKFLQCSTGDFLKCWQDMDNQWITRVINIEASLEKSKTIAIHEYYQSLVTRGLVYKVSHAALKLITVELTNMGKSRFGGKCLCIIRKTPGLPCACEIVNSHKNGNHISLNNIHDHWKQLSMDPAHEKVAAIFDWEDLFGKIRMKYEACTELQKHFMLEMLIEIADPSKTNMQEPKGKFASKGRPTLAQTEAQKKIDKSTKRDLSSWERPPTGNNSAIASKKVKPTTSKRVQPISKKGRPKKKGVKSHLADKITFYNQYY